MKKLLITTMAAASLAFCAKAADDDSISGINFESTVFTDGVAIDTDAGDDGNTATAGYWSTESTDGLFVISNLTSFANAYPADDNRPDYWAGTENSKALFIDSDKPLLRNVNALSGGTHAPQSLADGDLFFDSVVQFTATDTAPTPDTTAGDKLIAWLYASEDASTETPGIFGETAPLTNLVITSGTRATGSLSMTNYFTNIAIEPDTWHRLTIKSFIDGGRVYFNVWVDGTQVTSGEETNFLSLTDPGSQTTDASVTGTTVTAVAFDGKGAVDDLVFTTTDPFPQVVTTYAITTTYDASAVAISFSEDEAGDEPIDDTSTLDVSVATVYAYIEVLDEGATVTGITLNGTAVGLPELEDDAYNVLLPLGTPVAGSTYELVISTTTSGTETPTTYAVTADYNNPMFAVANLETAYEANASVSFTVTAVDGYEVTGVTMNGTALTGNNGTYSFAMPAANVEIVVTAQAKLYELTLTAANATVTGVATGMYAYNSEISFKVEVASDYTLKGVTMNDNALTAGNDGSYTFTMPAAEVALVVTTEKTQEEEAAQPTVNGTAATDADDFIDAAKSGSTITLPTGWELNTETGVITDADGNTYATFESYYTATPGEDGTFTVAFNDTAKPEVGDSTAGDAIAVTTDTVTLGITNAKKDLYYTVKAYSDVACTKALGAGDSVQADEDGVLSIPITKPADVDAAFFKVMVDDKAVVTTEAQ